MLKKKWVTWVLICCIGLLPIPAFLPYLQTFIVRNAVVTAYLYEVRAPIDGIVEVLDAQAGTLPNNGPALILGNRRLPHTDIESLEARYLGNQRFHGFLQEELSALEIRLDDSEVLFAGYRNIIQKDLDLSLAILEARQDGDAARLKAAGQLRERTIPLAKTSIVAQEKVDRIEADFTEAQARLLATRLEQEQVRQRRQVLKNDLFLSGFADGVLQEQNQINNLQLKILDCKRRIHEIQADIAAEAVQIKALGTDLEDRLAKAEVVLPKTAVIWDVDVKIGMEVAKGDRMLSYIDRSRLMVDVAIDDATLALIHPDHFVRIRMFGSGRFISGKVIRVLGSGADWPDHRFAAGIKDRSVRDGRVLVQIEDEQLQGDVKRFCGVGRAAYAEFEGIGLIEQYFGTFLR